MRRILVSAALAAATLVAAIPAHAATVRVQRFSDFRDVTVAGAPQIKYRLRLAYTVPSTWPLRGTGSATSRTFRPIGSCRFTVKISSRAVADASEDAAARAARLAPATGA